MYRMATPQELGRAQATFFPPILILKVSGMSRLFILPDLDSCYVMDQGTWISEIVSHLSRAGNFMLVKSTDQRQSTL